MARQALTVAGYVAGFFLPGGPAVWGAIGAAVGSYVDPQVIKGPRLGEGQENFAAEGGFRPIVLGKGAVGVCMINQGPLITRTIRQRQSKGSGPVTEEQRFYRTMAFGLGESAYPDDGVILLRLWIDGKLRYDVTPTSQIVAESAEFADQFTFYPGNNTQSPDPDLEAFMGAGNVSSYRGGAPYIVFPNYDVTSSSGRAPQIKAELASAGTVSLPGIVFAIRQSNGGVIDVSQDGVTFPDTVDTGLGLDLSRLFVANGFLYAFAGDAAGVVSKDRGVTFEPLTGLPSGGGNCNGIDYNGVNFVAVWQSSAIIYSSNGVDFSNSTAPGGNFHSVASKGLTVVVGRNNYGFCTSVDAGVNFTNDSFIGPAMYGLIEVEGGFYSGSVGTFPFRTSVDGSAASWSDDPNPIPEAALSQVGFGRDENGTLIAVCGTRSAFKLTDVSPWTEGGALEYSPSIQNVTSNQTGVYVSGGFEYYWRSQNGAASWTQYFLSQKIDLVAMPESSSGQAEAEPIPLSTIATWLHDRVDVPSTKIDVSELTDMVEGVVLAGDYSAADAMRTFMTLYFFDAGEFDAGSGYRLNYVKRGADAVVTLTEHDIIEGPEDWEREDSYERPKVLHVAYQNPIADYGAPNISIKRTSPDALVVGERSASVPVVFSDADEITRRADIMMTVIYAEIAGTYEIVLPDSLLELAPTVAIGFSIRGKVRRLRMTGLRYGEGVMRTEWMADRQSCYTSNVSGLPPVATTPPPPSIVGPTVGLVLDIPALADSLDTLHLPLAAAGQTSAWWGATQQRKLEADTNFSNVAAISAPGSIIGATQGVVTAASPHYTDTTNVITVELYNDDEIETLTQQQFLSEAGAFALSWDDGGTRRWEVMQYRDAVKVGERTWELSYLARGRLNTTAAEHAPGAMFVLLDYGISYLPMQSAWIDTQITHRTVSNGQLPENAVPYAEEWTAQCQVEFPVAHLFAEKDGDTLELSCVPRHRFGTEDNPIRSVNWSGYRWTATDGSNATQVDTLTDATSIDVTGWSTPITVTVAQLNRYTGAGETVSEEVT